MEGRREGPQPMWRALSQYVKCQAPGYGEPRTNLTAPGNCAKKQGKEATQRSRGKKRLKHERSSFKKPKKEAEERSDLNMKEAALRSRRKKQKKEAT